MGIKVKHLDDYIFEGEKIGNAATGKVRQIRAPFDFKVVYIAMKAGTAGTTGSQTGDVNINGTSVFAATGDRPSITTGTDIEKNGADITGTKTGVKGDLIDISIDVIHTTPAVDTSFTVILRQMRKAGVEY